MAPILADFTHQIFESELRWAGRRMRPGVWADGVGRFHVPNDAFDTSGGSVNGRTIGYVVALHEHEKEGALWLSFGAKATLTSWCTMCASREKCSSSIWRVWGNGRVSRTMWFAEYREIIRCSIWIGRACASR